jgi:hypothetical protein
MVETAVFNATLATSIAFRMTMIAFCFVQPAWLAGCWLAIAPTTVGVPAEWSVCDNRGSSCKASCSNYMLRPERVMHVPCRIEKNSLPNTCSNEKC